jgi:hypothetical protein
MAFACMYLLVEHDIPNQASLTFSASALPWNSTMVDVSDRRAAEPGAWAKDSDTALPSAPFLHTSTFVS